MYDMKEDKLVCPVCHNMVKDHTESEAARCLESMNNKDNKSAYDDAENMR